MSLANACVLCSPGFENQLRVANRISKLLDAFTIHSIVVLSSFIVCLERTQVTRNRGLLLEHYNFQTFCRWSVIICLPSYTLAKRLKI